MSVLLPAALIGAAQVAAAASADISQIVVQGSGTIKTAPNVATLTYDVRSDGASSDAALSSMVATSAAVEKSLRSIDSNVEIHSDSVRIQAVRPKDCEERDYEDTVHLGTGECAIKGYVAVQDYTVRTTHIRDAGTLVGLAGRRGAYNPKIESFGLVDQTSAKNAAIAKAMADAQAKADAVAAATAARRGSIISVSLDGAREQLSSIVVTGSRNNLSAERDDPIVVSVDPAPVETTAQVTVSYAISR